MRLARFAWVTALLAASAGCDTGRSREQPACAALSRPFDPTRDADYAAYAASVARTRCPKPWTVLIYMAADVEDLPAQAFADLREMEDALVRGGLAAASSERADVIVQLDLPGSPGLRRYHLFSRTGAVEPVAVVPSSPEVASLPEAEGGPPEQALAEFVAWGRAQYPSDRVMVVLWGHGQGWRPRTETGERVRYVEGGFVGGFGFDHSQGTVMDVPAVAAALRGSGDTPIDVLVTDACLMQSVDVAGTLATAARNLVGHEQIDPYAGLPYDRVIPLVNGQRPPPPHPACRTDDEACRVAVSLPSLLLAPGGATEETFVASAAAADALSGELLPALARLSTALVAFLDEDRMRSIDVLARLASRSPGEAIPGFAGNTVDLGVLLVRLRQEAQEEALRCASPCPGVTGLLAALDDSERALDAVVLTVAVGPAYAEDDAYAWTSGPLGLSVWLPPHAEVLAARRAAFASSPASGWLPWLDRLHAAP